MRKKKGKVVVAMSGGVDSSVAAKMMFNQGHESLGIFLHFWKPPYAEASTDAKALGDKSEGKDTAMPSSFENKCCSAKAFMDARRVCEKVGIKLYTLNFSREFKKDIVDNFLSEYKSGNTPNPCVRCNRLVKLGLLIKRAQKLGYDYVASGHYARLKKSAGKVKMYRARDEEKDQSYFLWNLTQDQLKHLIFPLGDYKKSEVRKLAKKYDLPVASKKESQEVCFIPEKSHNDFLKRYLKLKPGKIKTLEGKIIGEHQGLPLYTVGQRRGVEIGGTGPYYVARADYKTNTLYVVSSANDDSLFSSELIARDVNWISGKEPKFPLKCKAVARYRSELTKCKVEDIKPAHNASPARQSDGSHDGGQREAGGSKVKGKKYLVKFEKPLRAVTPGQSVVFYRKDEVLGGGVIALPC